MAAAVVFQDHTRLELLSHRVSASTLGRDGPCHIGADSLRSSCCQLCLRAVSYGYTSEPSGLTLAHGTARTAPRRASRPGECRWKAGGCTFSRRSGLFNHLSRHTRRRRGDSVTFVLLASSLKKSLKVVIKNNIPSAKEPVCFPSCCQAAAKSSTVQILLCYVSQTHRETECAGKKTPFNPTCMVSPQGSPGSPRR